MINNYKNFIPSTIDETLWSKHFDFNYEPHNSSIDSQATITVENDFKNNYFQLKVRRKSNDAKLFDMGSHTPFIFANGYIEISTLLINDIMYGLGQSNQPFRHNFSIPRVSFNHSHLLDIYHFRFLNNFSKKWNLFNQYHDNLTMNATSLFGSHPFYLGIDDPKQGNAYGVLLLNSFPLQAIINARPSLTLRTIGGHLELVSIIMFNVIIIIIIITNTVYSIISSVQNLSMLFDNYRILFINQLCHHIGRLDFICVIHNVHYRKFLKPLVNYDRNRFRLNPIVEHQ